MNVTFYVSMQNRQFMFTGKSFKNYINYLRIQTGFIIQPSDANEKQIPNI